MKDLIVEGMIVPGNGNLSYQHEITIDIDQTATATGLSTESVYSNLKTLLATVTQVDFEFGAESRKVTVDRDNSAFLTYLDEYGYASSPNSMATRSGILRLVLVERIPLS
jgi:multidrug efflux pump subunit AcrB